MPSQGQCQGPVEKRGRTSNHAPYLPFSEREGPFPSPFLLWLTRIICPPSPVPHKTFTTVPAYGYQKTSSTKPTPWYLLKLYRFSSWFQKLM
ncbi:hypothetical protein LEMLEM_LOCUS25411 [Lemmus lemmus]